MENDGTLKTKQEEILNETAHFYESFIIHVYLT
jgi:hypothetical protein